MSMSKEQRAYLSKRKKEKLLVIVIQIFLVVAFFILWEVLSRKNIINSFIFSSPSKIIKTISGLIESNNLFPHIWTTVYEILIAFFIGIAASFVIAIVLYQFPIVAKIVDPFLTMLNSLPKVALGPLIIIIVGANTKSIITMALLINLIVTTITIYTGFLNTDECKFRLLKSFGATKRQILTKLVIPGAYETIISSLKLNISMTLIGVIMGEFLVSKKGIGYLIIYGTQVFNLSMVMSGILILIILSYIMYLIVGYIEKILIKK